MLVAFYGLLRAAELLKIRVSDVVIRNEHIRFTTIKLQVTKSNREQYAVLPPNSYAERALVRLLQKRPNQFRPLFGWRSYRDLYNHFHAFNEHFRLHLHLTPHSLRAGGATFRKGNGESISDIMDAGRWGSLQTTRSYVDIVFTMLHSTHHYENQVWPTTPDDALAHLLAHEFWL